MYHRIQAQALRLGRQLFLLSIDRDRLDVRFFRLAFINILSNLMVPLAGLLGVAFLGHLSEIRHLAGIALSTIIFNYLYRVFNFLRMSTTGVTAQAVGREDREAVLLAGLRNGCLALAAGIAILVVQYPLREIGFAFLNAAPAIELSGRAYYNARIWAAPATLLNFVLFGWFLGREQSGKVLVLSLIGNAVNILLDYLLILRWGWESTGAGSATAIAQYLMSIAGIILVSREVQWQEVRSLCGQIFSLTALKDTVSLNRDIFIRTLAFLSVFSLFTNLSGVMGTNILAENAILLEVITLAVYAIDGLAFATETLVGVCQGEGAKEKLLPLLRLSGSTSLLAGLGFATVFVLFPTPLFSLLTDHWELLNKLDRDVFWLLPVLGCGSIAFMLDGYFLGLAEGSILRNSALMATVIGFAPIAIAAWQLQSFYLLWLAMASFMAARAIFLGLQVPKTLDGTGQALEKQFFRLRI